MTAGLLSAATGASGQSAASAPAASSAAATSGTGSTSNAKDSKSKDGEKGEDSSEKHRIPKGGAYKLPGETGTFLRAPYLQCATPSSIHIVWRTLQPMERPIVRFGSSADTLDKSVEGPAIVLRRLADEGDRDTPIHAAPVGTHQFEAHITGLAPDTKYFYSIHDGDQRLTHADGTYWFRTLPNPGTFRDCLFWVVGDSGTGQRAPKSVHRAMRDWLAANKLELDFYAHVGDMAYNDGKDLEFTDNFFKIYADTLRRTVCFPAMGNHEGHSSNGNTQLGPYYDAYVCPTRGEAGGEPSGTEAYYSYDFGRVHMIVLNSHDADRRATASMARWLKHDLEKLQPARTDWTLAYWHHPPYTKGSHDSDRERQLKEMRQFIIPILESHGVDMTLTGHSHIYERSMLVDGAHGTPTTAYKDPVSGHFVVLDDGDGHPDRDGAYRKSGGIHDHEGMVHIVAGHGGTKNSAKFGGASPIMKKVSLDHGSVLVRVHGDTLTAMMLTYQGHEFDTFQIVKSGRITPQRIPNPRVLTRTWAGTSVPEPIPGEYVIVVPPNAEWRVLTGSDPDSDAWTRLGFDDAGWKVSRAGFGYDYPELETELKDMRNKYRRVYLRREFALDSTEDAAQLGLAINFDDGFIAYLNGEEVARQNVTGGRGRDATGVSRIDKGIPQFISLAHAAGKFRIGKNVLAVEGHNDSTGSSDFVLEPWLLRKK